MVEKLSARRSNTASLESATGVHVPSRLLIQVRNKEDRKLLQTWLAGPYEVLLADSEEVLHEPFDLCIIDGPTLKRLRAKVRARRKEEEPVFLPFLLMTVRRKGSRPARYLGRLVDDLILRPLHQ